MTSFPQCHLETVITQKKPYETVLVSKCIRIQFSKTVLPNAECSQEFDCVVGNGLRIFQGVRRKTVAQIATKLPRTGSLVHSIIPMGASARNRSCMGHLAACVGPRLDAGPYSTSGPLFSGGSYASERPSSATLGNHRGGARARRAPCEVPRLSGRPCRDETARCRAADVFVHGRGFPPRARGCRSSSRSEAPPPLKFRPNRFSFLRVPQ